MTYFYSKDGEVFIPEKINPELVKISNAIIKSCKLNFKLKLKTTALNNALKSGKTEQMHDIIQKCFDKNKKLYDNDMALTGVTIEETDISFFEDKDEEFYKNQIKLLTDFATINTVIESGFMSVLADTCEKMTGSPLNKVKFFTNQDVILELEEEETE